MNVLYVSPYIGIKKHQEIELSHANHLRKQGHRVTFLHCSGLFNSFCVTMSAFGLVESSDEGLKKSACLKCLSISEITDPFYAFPSYMFEDFATNEILASVNSAIKNLDKDNLKDFFFEGIAVGTLGSYEFLLNHKLNTAKIPEELWSAFVEHLRNAMISIAVANEIFKSHQYDLVISYNRLYAVHRVFSEVALNHGICTYSIQAAGPINDLYSRFSLLLDDKEIFTRNKSENWIAYRGTNISFKKITVALRHLRSLRAAKSPWVYSSPAKRTKADVLRTRIGAAAHHKIFLLTTSSQDELFAAEFAQVYTPPSERPLFDSNKEWILWLCTQLELHPNWFLIVRPHPREFPNKRESVVANSMTDFAPFLNTLKGHSQIFVNTPEDGLSLYDLMKITDVHLNSTSTVGLEMVLNGIPSVHFSDSYLTAYPPAIGHAADSIDQYATLMLTTDRGYETDKLKLAINWIWFTKYLSTQRTHSFWGYGLFTASHVVRKAFKGNSKISQIPIGLLRACYQISKISKFKVRTASIPDVNFMFFSEAKRRSLFYENISSKTVLFLYKLISRRSR